MSLVPHDPYLPGGGTSTVESDNDLFAEYITLQFQCSNLAGRLHDCFGAAYQDGMLAIATSLYSESLPLTTKVHLWKQQLEGMRTMEASCSDRQQAAIATGPAAPGQPPASQNSGVLPT
jgi:hypothetical protein